MLSQSPSINSFIHSSIHLSVHSVIYHGAQEQFPHSTSSPVPATYFPIARSLPSREGPAGTYHTVWTKWRMKETISKSHHSQQHYALMTGCLPEVLACSPGNTHLASFTLPGFSGLSTQLWMPYPARNFHGHSAALGPFSKNKLKFSKRSILQWSQAKVSDVFARLPGVMLPARMEQSL